MANNGTPTEKTNPTDGLRSNSATSINTLASIGFPEDAKDGGAFGQLDEDSFSAGSGDFICLEAESHCIPKDIICLLVICPQHGALALKQIVNDCYFLPTFQFDGDSQSLTETVRNVVGMHDPAMVSDEFDYWPRLRLIALYRVELLKTRAYINRYIYELNLTKKEPLASITEKPCVCSHVIANQPPSESLAILNRNTSSEDTVWLTLQSIPLNIINIWGGEPFKVYLESVRTGGTAGAEQLPPEHKPTFSLSELDSNHAGALLSRTDWLRPMMNSIRSNLPNMFDSAVYNLYNEFVVQCFPSDSMGFSSFCILLDKLGLVVGNAQTPINEPRKHIFRALDSGTRHFVTFENLCIGLIVFELNNDAADLAHRQEFIFRFYDVNGDGRLDGEEYKQLLVDFITRSKIDEPLRRLDKTRPVFIKEMFEQTWTPAYTTERNGALSMSYQQYLKAFETVNQPLSVQTWWLPVVPFFEQIFFKFNCRTVPISPVQHLVDSEVNYNRCEICSERKFSLSSSLIQLTDVGAIRNIFHLKATTVPPVSFVDEFHEKNIHNIANEFLNRIEKIGKLTTKSVDSEEEENAKNYFFPTRHKMLRYLHLILEYANRLIESDAKVLELTSPCFVFGDVNGSLKDLLHFSGTVFRTFPFLDWANLLFLGNYTDVDSSYNLECLIYLVCLKILSPGRVYLLRGANELASRGQISMQDRTDASEEPLNDIVCHLLAQIFDSMPIAAVIEESIFASHSGIPKEFSLSHMKLVCEYGSAPSRSLLSLGPKSSLSSVTSTAYDDQMSELLLQVIVGEPSPESDSFSVNASTESLFNVRDFELFLSSSKLFCAIRSHQELPEDGYRMNGAFSMATIVSSTKGAKVPTCIYIDHKLIRLIRFEVE